MLYSLKANIRVISPLHKAIAPLKMGEQNLQSS